jgi:hypothetical protein
VTWPAIEKIFEFVKVTLCEERPVQILRQEIAIAKLGNGIAVIDLRKFIRGISLKHLN